MPLRKGPTATAATAAIAVTVAATTVRFRYVNVASLRQLFLLIFDIAARNVYLRSRALSREKRLSVRQLKLYMYVLEHVCTVIRQK